MNFLIALLNWSKFTRGLNENLLLLKHCNYDKNQIEKEGRDGERRNLLTYSNRISRDEFLQPTLRRMALEKYFVKKIKLMKLL